ncbi:MAG TPA: M20/M25/M40 family metallo-hydrolase [Gryllotalpicola sp.]
MSGLPQQRIQEWVRAHEDEIVGFLLEYLDQISVNPRRAVTEREQGGERAAQEWLAAQAERLSLGAPVVWRVDEGRPNLGWSIGAGDTHGVVFNGHVDTVGVSPQQLAGWLSDPYHAEVRDGRVYGRGANDMKAGTVAFLWAAKAITELGLPLQKRIGLTVTSAEESTEAELGILTLPAHGFTGELLVCAEPTSGAFCPAGLGMFYFRVEVTGRTSHTATRYGSLRAFESYERGESDDVIGVDAVSLATRYIAALNELDASWSERPTSPLLDEEVGRSICPIRVAGGASAAEIAGDCVVEFCATLDPGDSVEAATAEIVAAIAKVTDASRWLSAHPPRLTLPIVHRVIEPLNFAVGRPIAEALVAELAAIVPSVRLGAMPGPCDANIIASELGAPAVVFGPGLLADGAHGENESVVIAELLEVCIADACLMLTTSGARA